jgi:hypothetical protein
MVANVKTLVSGIPTIDTATGFVSQWNFVVNVTESGEGEDLFSREYPLSWTIDTPSKAPGAYTQQELLNAVPAGIDGAFDAAYEVSQPSYTPPQESINDFDINTLPSGGDVIDGGGESSED